MQYDLDGLVRRSVNRRNQAILQTWDARHRPLVRSGPGIADTVTYAASGDSVRRANAFATETMYLANSRRLVDSVRTVLRLPGGGTRTFVRRYWYRTLDARLDSMATFDRNGPVGFVSRGFGYNTTTGTLTGMRLGASGTTTFAYDNDLNRIGVFFPDQDSLYQLLLEGHDVALVSSPVANDTLMNDSLGRLTRFFTSDDGRQRVFAYDGLGRLGSTQYQTRNGGGCGWYFGYGWVCGATLDSIRTFGYDAAGNLSGIGRDGIVGNIGLAFGWGNRIQAVNGPGYPAAWSCTYGTDLDGNVTGRSCTSGAGAASASLYWSADGRLDSVGVGGARMAYRYDAAGRLVRRDSAGAVVSWFLWNGDDLLAELSADGNTKVAEYSYYGMDDLHAVILGTTPYYAHTDVVGNIRGYTHASTRYGTYTYDEFGRLLPGGNGAFGVLERPHWKGALWMEPGADLYYMRNRWYEPFTGRFLSEDPVGLAGGLNPYAFAGSDPVNRSDPTGLDWVWRCAWTPGPLGASWTLSCGWVWESRSPYDVRNDDYCPRAQERELGCRFDLGHPRNSPAKPAAPPEPPAPAPLQGPSCGRLALTAALGGIGDAFGLGALDAVRLLSRSRRIGANAQRLWVRVATDNARGGGIAGVNGLIAIGQGARRASVANRGLLAASYGLVEQVAEGNAPLWYEFVTLVPLLGTPVQGAVAGLCYLNAITN